MSLTKYSYAHKRACFKIGYELVLFCLGTNVQSYRGNCSVIFKAKTFIYVSEATLTVIFCFHRVNIGLMYSCCILQPALFFTSWRAVLALVAPLTHRITLHDFISLSFRFLLLFLVVVSKGCRNLFLQEPDFAVHVHRLSVFVLFADFFWRKIFVIFSL